MPWDRYKRYEAGRDAPSAADFNKRAEDQEFINKISVSSPMQMTHTFGGPCFMPGTTEAVFPVKITASITAATWDATGVTAYGSGTCVRVTGLGSLGGDEAIYNTMPDAVTAPAAGWATIFNGSVFVINSSCTTITA